jgi:glyoxylase-like metal-dependent hydrolase (beta-lactamase superfamily II)/rhodanese-related sulfurtransferase
MSASDHLIVPLVDEGLGNSSYVVHLGDGRALAIDPERDPTPYLGTASNALGHIAYCAETHLHADFVSGSRELAAQGAQVLAPAAGHSEFPHRGLVDGEDVDLGGLTLRALATPGHTPEHLSYLLLDGASPLALFSGGSLLVGSMARTDLITPDQTEQLARALWRSLHERILALPDDLPVYPTHGAGSFCSAPAGGQRTTTIGAEKAGNALLAAPDEDAFVKLLLAGLGTYPPYFTRLREVNRRGPAVYGPEPPTLARLDAATVRRRVAEGAVMVDVRPITAFAESHIPGSLSIELRAEFATWLGWLVEEGRPIVFVLDPHQDRAEVVRQALKVGYESLDGELAGGMAAWQRSGFEDRRTELVPAARATGVLVDIRQAPEFASGHIPGALHAELGLVDQSALPRGPLTVMCGHGERAMSAASILEAAGNKDVAVMLGGPADWSSASGQSLVTGP